MGQVTAALVKQLREKTGAGMMDCKKALSENDADVEVATDWLRKKGLAAAAKKAGRIASEGLVGVKVDGTRGALVEINSETDFVARNEDFQTVVRSIAGLAPEANGNAERLQAMEVPGSGRSVTDEITQAIATIGENISFRRTAAVEVDQGVVASYVHSQLSPGLGKIGVLVGLKSAGDAGELEALGKQLAMHVAAAKPEAVSVDRLDAETVSRERAIYADQAKTSGKPENIIEWSYAQILRRGCSPGAGLRRGYRSQGQAGGRSRCREDRKRRYGDWLHSLCARRRSRNQDREPGR